ncbi:MarR family winged helix-turn-helix transcriptional regulator [Thalassotalea ganghwensis]
MTKLIKKPLDLMAHLPFRIAVVSNLLALNRDWRIRQLTDLDPREMRVLLNIGSYMPVKSADVAYQSRLDSYTVSRAVKKLLSLNLIETQADPHKKNVKNLVLNEQGRALYHKMIEAMEERSKRIASVLSEQEQEMFFDMLERIESKTEQTLAEQAIDFIAQGQEPPADQKELIRWYKKSQR